jgi:hypothetical protein
MLKPFMYHNSTLQPCALNVEFQHFIVRFSKISLLFFCDVQFPQGRTKKLLTRFESGLYIYVVCAQF